MARNGGAIALLGSAFLRVNNNTQMMFSGNTATKFGGAIYHSALGQHEHYLFGFCFIQYVDIITHPGTGPQPSTSRTTLPNSEAGATQFTPLLSSLVSGRMHYQTPMKLFPILTRGSSVGTTVHGSTMTVTAPLRSPVPQQSSTTVDTT